MKWTVAQERAIKLRGKNIIVSASAGSGKTSVMIERIVGLLEEGADLKDFLIVTFTRAAAADMKDKLARRLSQSLDARLKNQLKLLSSADIGTLHSFCQKLIGRYFYLAGLDPDYTVIEQSEASALFFDCIAAVTDEEYTAGSSDFLELVEILGGRSDEPLAKALSEFYGRLALRPDFDISVDDTHCLAALSEELEQTKIGILKSAKQLFFDTSAADFTRNIEAAQRLIPEIEACVMPSPSPRSRIPAGCEILNDRYKKLREAAKKLAEKADKIKSCAPASTQYLKVLLRMAKRLREVFLAAKKSQSKADFNDLEHYALTILRSEAGGEIRRQYKYVFVDEYQDINPLQNEIIDMLTSGGNLFLVGDLKQSIYAFRGCEPKIFARKIKAYAELDNHEVIELNANYRSDYGILHFANRVFEHIMTEQFGGSDYKKSGSFALDLERFGGKASSAECAKTDGLTAEGYPKEQKNGGVSFYFYPKSRGKKTGVYDVLEDGSDDELSAALAAARITELLKKTVTDEGKTRAANLSDIAVLVRSAGPSVSALVKRLGELGLKADVSEGLVSTSRPEIVALTRYLRLIDNRLSDTSLINSLKSRFGGFSDDELAQIRLFSPHADSFYAAAFSLLKAEEGTLDTTQNAIKRRLLQFFATLDGYRTLAEACPAAEVIDKVVTDFKYFQYVFMFGEAAAEALEAYLDLAGGTDKSLSEFLQGAPEKTPASSVSEDAVRIMTVHSAKGLEFPFVLILDAHKKFNLNDIKQDIIVFDKLAAIKHFDHGRKEALPSHGWLFNRDSLSRRQREEEMRLLYVAVTRAKYDLSIFAEHECADNEEIDGETEGQENGEAERSLCWLKWLLPFAAGYERTITPAEVKIQDRHIPATDGDLVKMLRQNLSFAPPAVALPPKTYVTALLNGEEDAVYIAGGEDDRAALIGTLYHRAMELIDFYGDFEPQWAVLDGEVKADVDKNDIKKAVEVIAPMFESGWKILKEQGFIIDLTAEEAGLAAKEPEIAGNQKSSEVAATVNNKESVLVQGVIDFIAVSGGRAVIIDYKTGGVSAKYKRQLELYALAARRILGVDVTKTYIYSFKEARLIDTAEL